MVDYINLEANNLSVVMKCSKISQVTELENLFADMQELMLEMEAINYEACNISIETDFLNLIRDVIGVADYFGNADYFIDYPSKLVTKGGEVNKLVNEYLAQFTDSEEDQEVVRTVEKWLQLLNQFCQKSELLVMATTKLQAMLTATLLNCVDAMFIDVVAESNTVTPATEGSDSDIETGEQDDAS